MHLKCVREKKITIFKVNENKWAINNAKYRTQELSMINAGAHTARGKQPKTVMKMPHRHNYNVSFFYAFTIPDFYWSLSLSPFLLPKISTQQKKNVLNKFRSTHKIGFRVMLFVGSRFPVPFTFPLCILFWALIYRFVAQYLYFLYVFLLHSKIFDLIFNVQRSFQCNVVVIIIKIIIGLNCQLTNGFFILFYFILLFWCVVLHHHLSMVQSIFDYDSTTRNLSAVLYVSNFTFFFLMLLLNR